MAKFLFVSAIMAGQPSRLFNHGKMRRDFTCIDDVTRVVSKLIDLGSAANPAAANAQPGDVVETFADVEDLMRDTGFAPSMPIEHGVRNFVTWYRDHFKV